MSLATSQWLYLGLLLLVGGQRLFELRLSRRNLAHAEALGGAAVREPIFPWIVLLHALFLPCVVAEVLLLERPFHPPVGWAALLLVAAAQGLRIWAIATLGPRWNVRLVRIPGAPPITGGPYRWLRHPNYLAVALEFLFLPLIHGAVWSAVAFSAANALLLARRIPAEEALLGAPWRRAFARRPRFLPRPPANH